MEKITKQLLVLTSLIGMLFLAGGIFASPGFAIDVNDFELDVQALSTGNDSNGLVPVIVLVTYQGAGLDMLTAANFSTDQKTQMVPSGCSTVAFDANAFNDRGNGVYHLGVRADTSWCSGNYYVPIKVDARAGFGIKASGMTVLDIFRFSFDL